jgi:hypothetical protein
VFELPRSRIRTLLAALACGAFLAATAFAGSHGTHTSKPFKGVKVNGGTVTHSVTDGKNLLTLSDDFKSPDAPAPHWQVVDSAGHTYLLQQLMVKGDHGDRLNRTIAVPAYVGDIAKVQIWCAWAQTLLGETTFDAVLTLPMKGQGGATVEHTSSMFMGVKANTGSVTHTHSGKQCTLTLSDDFKAPDAPAPCWQVVDSKGNVYLLQRLLTKGEKGDVMNRSIVVPAYVPDVAKVQMWCSYAEVLLGEATFAEPVK